LSKISFLKNTVKKLYAWLFKMLKLYAGDQGNPGIVKSSGNRRVT
jgi:hypothetical protein